MDTPETHSTKPEAEPIVSLQNVTKRFGDTLAVDNLSFDVFDGNIFGFIGPNGAGKTTTLKLIADAPGTEPGCFQRRSATAQRIRSPKR